MKTPTSFIALVLSLSLTGPLLAGAGDFVANVAGTRKYQSTKNAKNIIASEALNLKTIATAFGVSAKDYALVFNAGTGTLSLVPLKAVPAKTTYQILSRGANLGSYNSASPSQFITVDELTAGADAAATKFEGIKGTESVTVKTKAGNATGAIGTFVGVAVGANPDYSLFQFTISAAKPFVQK